MAISSSVLKAIKSTGKEMFKKVDNPHKFLDIIPGVPYTLKTKYALGIPLAYGAAAGTIGMVKATNEAKLGEMQGDQLANTVNISNSDTLDTYLQNAETPEQIEQIRQEHNSFPLRTANATGDLVFALHNLRGGR